MGPRFALFRYVDHATEHVQDTGKDGNVRWHTHLEIELELPPEQAQVPHIICELYNRCKIKEVDTRTHVLRVKHAAVGAVEDMLWSSTSADIEQSQIAATWVQWTRDQCADIPEVGSQSPFRMVEAAPMFLMALGVDNPPQLANRNLKTSLAYHQWKATAFPQWPRLQTLSWAEGSTPSEQVRTRLEAGGKYWRGENTAKNDEEPGLEIEDGPEKPFLLRVCIYQARNLPVKDLDVDVDGHPDPVVMIEVAQFACVVLFTKPGTDTWIPRYLTW